VIGAGCEWRRTGAAAVPRHHKHPPATDAGVDWHARARTPHASADIVRGEAQCIGLLQRACVICEQPAVPVAEISVCRVAEIDIAVVIIQGRALVLPQWAEADLPARTPGPGS